MGYSNKALFKHHFLTGDIGIGKSTVLQKALAETAAVPGGFRTRKHVGEDGQNYICMYAAADMTFKKPNASVAAVGTPGCGFTITDIFDTLGKELLEKCTGCRLILMDEIGYLESSSLPFQKAIRKTLDGPVPCIGVLRKKRTAFLDELRNREDVKLYEVTAENREQLAGEFTKLIEGLLKNSEG